MPSRQFRCLNTWFSYSPDWPADTWCRASFDNPNGQAAMSDLDDVHRFMEEFGYQSVNLGDATDGSGLPQTLTVEGLKSVSGDGVFLWTTHGGTLDPDGNIIQGLMTATTAFQSTVEDTYADEFAEGTLIDYTGPLSSTRSPAEATPAMAPSTPGWPSRPSSSASTSGHSASTASCSSTPAPARPGR